MSGHVCAVCGRPLPLGGVLDAHQQRVHDLCRGLAQQMVQDLASRTVRRMTRGQAQPPRRPGLLQEPDR